jgi:hypothetical protein
VINALKTDLLATHPASKTSKRSSKELQSKGIKTNIPTNKLPQRERESIRKQKTHQAREKPKEESSRKFLLFFHRKEIFKKNLIEQKQATPKKKQKPTSLLQTRSPRLETNHRQAPNSRTLPE